MNIGGRKVIFSESVIVARDEMFSFEITVKGKPLAFEATFIEDPSSQPVTWSVAGDLIKMTFSNWHARGGALMQTLQKPFKIGIVNGVEFGFQVSCTVANTVYHVHLIFMTGGIYDE